MPKTIVLPPGTSTPIAPFSPGTMADGIVYVSGTLAFDKDNNVVHVGRRGGADPARAGDHQIRDRNRRRNDGRT